MLKLQSKLEWIMLYLMSDEEKTGCDLRGFADLMIKNGEAAAQLHNPRLKLRVVEQSCICCLIKNYIQL